VPRARSADRADGTFYLGFWIVFAIGVGAVY